MTNRRDFIRDACAAAVAAGLPARIWGTAETMGKPDLVIGLLSDIHVGDRKQAEVFRKALEAIALANDAVKAAIAGKTVRKVVAVPGRLVNIVAN